VAGRDVDWKRAALKEGGPCRKRGSTGCALNGAKQLGFWMSTTLRARRVEHSSRGRGCFDNYIQAVQATAGMARGLMPWVGQSIPRQSENVSDGTFCVRGPWRQRFSGTAYFYFLRSKYRGDERGASFDSFMSRAAVDVGREH